MSQAPRTSTWKLKPGDQLSRKLLHRLYAGTQQGGLTASRLINAVFVFVQAPTASVQGSGKDWSKGNHNYIFDGWVDRSRKIFQYTGSGRTGDQQMSRGNNSLLEHKAQGTRVHVFTPAEGTVTYIGEFELAPRKYIIATAKDQTGKLRKVIVFFLRPHASAKVKQLPISSNPL